MTSVLLCSLCFPATDPEPGFGVGHSRTNFRYTLIAESDNQHFLEDLRFAAHMPADVFRAASTDLAQLIRDKIDALRNAQEGTVERAMGRMSEYREYRLEVMFLEDKPLGEQLDILKQRLHEPGQGPTQTFDYEFNRE